MTRGVLAAVASVGVHAALFFAVPHPKAPSAVSAAPPRVDVELFQVPAAKPDDSVARAESRAVAPEKPRVVRPARPPAPAAVEGPGPEAEAPSDAPALDSARATLEETPSAPPGPPAPAPVLDTAELSRRLQAVAARCYPAAARRFRQTGEAEVRFCLDAAGTLAEATVSRSSGSDLLDQAARGCVVPGAAPYGADARGHCFTVPVRFGQ